MKEKIVEIIKTLLSMDEQESLEMNENLLLKGLDSLLFVELILQIEEEYGIIFPDERMNMFEMNTINNIILCIENLKNIKFY